MTDRNQNADFRRTPQMFADSPPFARIEWGGFRKGGSCNSRFVLKPDVAMASEVSISSKTLFGKYLLGISHVSYKRLFSE